MPNYTVQQGDTLSKIASQYGVSTSQISGYKSGNPNLIYPGEQLVIPTVQPAQVQEQPQINATGLTSGTGIDTNVFKPTETTRIGSQYTPIIESLYAKQKELVSTPTEQVPGVMDLANQYGYSANTQALNALQPEIASLNQQLADLNSQEQKAIGQYINANVSQGFSLGIEGRIKRQYAVEKSAVSANLGVKLAIAEMLQGNMDRARSIAKDVVDDLNYKNTQKRQDIETLYNYYGDVINSLSAKEKTELDNARADIIREEEYAREDYTQKTQAILDAVGSGINVDFTGEDLDKLTVEEISARIGEATQKKIAQEQANELALKNAGGGNGLTQYQLLTSLNSIRSQARQDAGIKLFTTSIQPSYNGALAAAAMGNSTGDIVLMRYIAKLTDPTTGVREEEYKTFKGAQGALQNLGVQFTKGMIGRGQLTDEGRKQLLLMATNLYDNAKTQYENSYSFYDEQAQILGFPQGTVSPSYTNNEKVNSSDVIIQSDGTQYGLDTSLMGSGTAQNNTPADTIETIKQQYAGQNVFFFKNPNGEIEVKLNLGTRDEPFMTTSEVQRLKGLGYIQL